MSVNPSTPGMSALRIGTVRLSSITAFYEFRNRWRAGAKAMDPVIPRSVRRAAWCLAALVVIALSPLALAFLPGRQDLSAAVLVTVCWLVAFLRGTGIRDAVTHSVSHGRRVLDCSPLTSSELYTARVVTPALVRALLSSVGAGLLAALVIGPGPAIVLTVNLVLIQYALLAFGMRRAVDLGERLDVRRVASILVVDAVVSYGSLALLAWAVRSSHDSTVLQAFGLGPQLVLMLVLVAVVVAIATTTRSASSCRTDRQRRWWGSERSLEFAHLLRDPHAFLNAVDSLPGLGAYFVFGLLAARTERVGADVIVLVSALVGGAMVFFELLDDVFEPSRNRILRGRAFDTQLLDGIAHYRYQTLYWVAFTLLAPFVVLGAVSADNKIAFFAGGAALAATACASVAAVTVYGTIKLSDLASGYREQSNTGFAITILQSIVMTALVPLGIAMVRGALFVQMLGPLGALGVLCLAGVAIIALPKVVAGAVRDSVWSVS